MDENDVIPGERSGVLNDACRTSTRATVSPGEVNLVERQVPDRYVVSDRRGHVGEHHLRLSRPEGRSSEHEMSAGTVERVPLVAKDVGAATDAVDRLTTHRAGERTIVVPERDGLASKKHN